MHEATSPQETARKLAAMGRGLRDRLRARLLDGVALWWFAYLVIFAGGLLIGSHLAH